jgi:hypothetical protein
VGPIAFILNASDLHPAINGDELFKYADDLTLIVPERNTSTITQEIQHISAWAEANNLRLNKTKTHELIVLRKGVARSRAPPEQPDLARTTSVKLLGVTIQDNLQMNEHVQNIVTSCNQCTYALKTLKAHGLHGKCLHDVCTATVLSRINYASAAWWGFASSGDLGRLQSTICKVTRWGLDGNIPLPSVTELFSRSDDTLFTRIQTDPLHVISQLLPPKRNHQHNLRQRSHDYVLPEKTTSLSRNFLCRQLYKAVY